MKKLSIAVLLLLIFAVYSFHEQNEAHVSIAPTNRNSSSGSGNTSNPPSSSSQQTSASYKDGTYQGDSTDAYYGNVQVQITVNNGKLSDVQFLQYPNDRGESIDINNQAMPQLKQEAIQAQNAQVDIVSGATQTSQAFQTSLQSALDKAKG